MSFFSVREGDIVEPSGDLCRVRIYTSELLLIFLDQHYRVRIEMSEEYPAYPKGVFEFEAEAVVLHNLPLDGLDDEYRIAYKSLIARGWAIMLEDPDTPEAAAGAGGAPATRVEPGSERDRLTPARRLLAEARNYRIERLAERSRQLYLDAIAPGLLFVWIAGTILWLLRDGIRPSFGPNAPEAINCFVAGATGAATSVALRMGSVAVTPGTSAALHWRESLTRLFIGGMTALLAYLLLGSGIVLAPLTAKAGTALALAISLIAGSTERAFPSFASKLPALQPPAPS